MSKSSSLLPGYARLHALLSYDPATGLLVWKAGTNRRIVAGAIAGVRSSNNQHHEYIKVGIDGRRYFAHRIIWKMVTGEEPSELIDHKDLDGLNNRWANLREATKAQNGMNRREGSKHLKGAVWDAGRRKWMATIVVDGRIRHLGRFETERDAHSAYMVAAVEHFGEFARAS